jgi:acylphosphatase
VEGWARRGGEVSGGSFSYRYRIQGRVQGVGFRWFVARNATRLRVMGYARNLPDGSVEVVAVAPDGACLAEFETLIGRGPEFAQVTSVDKGDISVDTNAHKTFDIR